MTIIEAIKSGKLHKRKTQREWCHPRSSKNETSIAYSIEDILADDWEVEEEKATITAAQFQKALDAASLSRQWIIPAPFVQDPAILHAYHRDVVAMFDDFVVKLKKELGL